MLTMLIVVIYITFFSLGLPDSVLGSAWPAMQETLGVPMSYAGLLSSTVAIGTVLSSLLSARLMRRFGTIKITIVSVLLTAIALVGFGLTNSFVVLLLLCIPLGVGAGAVDAALNNFVAVHYEARHLNWIHTFWGIAATLGPILIAWCLRKGLTWQNGFLILGIVQLVLTLIIIASTPLWKKTLADKDTVERGAKSPSLFQLIKIKNALPMFMSFFLYSGFEAIISLWASSYATTVHKVDTKTAVGWASMYFLFITIGRALSGFLSIKVKPKNMVRLGIALIFLGIFVLTLPLPPIKIAVALCLLGLGCAPIFPSVMHQTPKIFGKETSQDMVGVQFACSYIGASILPPIFGYLSEFTGMQIFPLYLVFFAGLLLLDTEVIRKRTADL